MEGEESSFSSKRKQKARSDEDRKSCFHGERKQYNKITQGNKKPKIRKHERLLGMTLYFEKISDIKAITSREEPAMITRHILCFLENNPSKICLNIAGQYIMIGPSCMQLIPIGDNPLS